jgi:hypothetical protein
MAELACLLEILVSPFYIISAIFEKGRTMFDRSTLILQIILDFFAAWFMILYMPYRIIRNYKEENNE